MASKLNQKQMAFALNVASGLYDQEDAALRAGYSAKCAKTYASRMMTKPEIRAEVDRIRAKAEAKSVGSKAEALDMIWATMQEAAMAMDRTNVYKGAELWLKATGQLVDKQQIEQTTRTIEIDWSASGGGDE
jgi:phage terminase small subunit